MEERLEVQEVREKRRVREAYEEGKRVQVKKGEAVVKELTQRSEQKVRRLTWELEEEKRKGLLKRRSLEGVRVKDRLAVRGSRLPRPVGLSAPKGTVVRAASQWKDYGEKWEAAKKRKDEADKALWEAAKERKDEADKALKAVEGRGRGSGMDLMDDEWVEDVTMEDRRWNVEEPREQRLKAGRGARIVNPLRGVRRTGPGRGALRPTFGATDVRLGEAGVSAVVDRG